MPAGRPSSYTDEIAEEICTGIAEGRSLVKVLATLEDAPSYRSVMRWLEENEKFRQKYMRAREDSGDYDADRMRDVMDKVESGELDPQAGRVVMDGLKWAAGKRKPKVYGDKITQEHTGANGAPLSVNVVRFSDSKPDE